MVYPKPHTVFASHSHHDNNKCLQYVLALRAMGLDVWVDINDLPDGTLLSQEIQSQLQQRTAFVIFLTPASVNSYWVQLETDAFRDLASRDSSRLMLPVVIEKCEVPILLRGLKWIDATSVPFDEAIKVIGKALNAPPLSIPSPIIAENTIARVIPPEILPPPPSPVRPQKLPTVSYQVSMPLPHVSAIDGGTHQPMAQPINVRPFSGRIGFISISSLIVVILASIFFFSHLPKSTQGVMLADQQTLTIAGAGTSDISTLDPANATDLNSSSIVNMCFAGLVGLDAQALTVTADLAQDIPTIANGGIINGGSTYIFHVRPGLKFSNGDPINASVMAYSIDRSLNSKFANGNATFYLEAIKGVSDRSTGKISSIIGSGANSGLVVVDALTLQINLTSPIAYFLDELTYSTAFAVDPLQKNANPSDPSFTDKWTDNPVTSGPFMVDQWQHGVQISLVPNPNWYGKKLTLTKVTQVFVTSANTAYAAYKSNQYDIDGFGGGAISTDNYPEAKALPNGQLQETPYLSIEYVATNWNIKPFDKLTVRKAFAEAIDRDTLATQTLKGSVISSDHIVPLGMQGYYAGLQGIPFNPQQAKTDLQSVYPDLTKFPQVTLTYPKTPDNDKIAAKMQSDFETYLGLTSGQIKIFGEDFNKLVSDVNTFKLQFYILAWLADYPDAQNWLSNQFTSTSANNDQNARIAGFDAQAAQADVDQNQTERLGIYNQMEEEAIDNVAWIPFSQGKNLYVVEPYVHGFIISADRLPHDDMWANVTILQH